MTPPAREPRDAPGDVQALDPTVMRIIESSFDIVTVLDEDDRVERISVGADFPHEIPPDWTGASLPELLAPETRGKGDELLERARRNGEAPPRHVNLTLPGSIEVPLDLSAVRIGSTGRLLAMGRSLRQTAEMQQRLVRAQQEMEQEYRLYRGAETRYQALMAMTGDPFLVVDWQSFEVAQANDAACTLLGDAQGSVVGASLPEVVAPHAPDTVRTFLDLYRSGETGGVFRDESMKASEMRVRRIELEDRAAILVRLIPDPGSEVKVGMSLDPTEVLEAIPDGLVILGRGGALEWMNPAFMDLVQLDGPELSSGRSLSDWLDRPGATAGILLATMSERGRIRLFRSSLRGELGLESDVEISGAPLAGERWVLVVRPVGRRLHDSGTPSASLATRVSELSGMLGTAGLKELVGTIADLVERHLILAALEATGGNRTAAAELLMLSRQTLYTKLRDHEISDHSGE